MKTPLYLFVTGFCGLSLNASLVDGKTIETTKPEEFAIKTAGDLDC